MELNYQDSLSAVLANNRSEHIGMDVWEDFVLPYFYTKIDFNSSFPLRLEGGRGSGKTMLLRYLSYHSRFSEKRKNIPINELEAVGLYLRADTQFLRQLQKRGIEEEKWHSIFSHYINTCLLTEICSALIKMSKASYADGEVFEADTTQLKSLKVYGDKFCGTAQELLEEFRTERKRCELAVANPRLIEELLILPDSTLTDIITEIKDSISPRKIKFKVYFDEYENLLKYQQLIINTRMKHSEPPLIFNIAAKLNGVPHSETTGNESLSYKHDYTIENLDNHLAGDSFECFAAEILFLRLSKSDPKYREIFAGVQLNSVDDLKKRLDDNYKERVLKSARSLLPGKSHEDLAEEIFSEPKLLKKLNGEIEAGLKTKSSRLAPEQFIDHSNKKASIVASSLMFRKKLSAEEILNNIELLKAGKDNKFTGSTSWIQNFFIGSYLKLLRSFKTESTFYAGFDVYVHLANGNMRHFLELCRTAFSNFSIKSDDNISIDFRSQHISAMQTSEILFREISSFMPHGKRLKTFCGRLGEIFGLFQERNSQSEPEITHFNIKGGLQSLESEDQEFLKEAEKWGILTTTTSTKGKSLDRKDDCDWVLNPIYSPYFFISYRKIRKTYFEPEELNAIISESGDKFDAVRNARRKKLEVSDESDTGEATYQRGLF
ncbi:hypothetical protein ACIGFL_15460 [Pseudomonas sp. NPDC077649]|uniref:ORC-CDC6 family AAA ATPase n=1 Tax=Pseudomonas sp. NPDC077649 TaxID=3364423 RepID=UPI0037C778DD